jgi:hypothetical protein
MTLHPSSAGSNANPDKIFRIVHPSLIGVQNIRVRPTFLDQILQGYILDITIIVTARKKNKKKNGHYISDDCFTVTILQNKKAQIIQR